MRSRTARPATRCARCLSVLPAARKPPPAPPPKRHRPRLPTRRRRIDVALAGATLLLSPARGRECAAHEDTHALSPPLSPNTDQGRITVNRNGPALAAACATASLT